MDSTITTKGSTFKPGDSSVYSPTSCQSHACCFLSVLRVRAGCRRSEDILSIVLLLPPAPAALVLDGLAFATLSALSAAALLLIAVAGPPGGFGDDGRAVVDPAEAGELTGEAGRGDD